MKTIQNITSKIQKLTPAVGSRILTDIKTRYYRFDLKEFNDSLTETVKKFDLRSVEHLGIFKPHSKGN
jgi:hypothetical protein